MQRQFERESEYPKDRVAGHDLPQGTVASRVILHESFRGQSHAGKNRTGFVSMGVWKFNWILLLLDWRMVQRAKKIAHQASHDGANDPGWKVLQA